jgi:hypothetical protein
LLFTANDYVAGGFSGTPGHVKITPVFWAPTGYSFNASYKTVIDGYLANVQAASGTNGNVFSVADEYYQQFSPNPKANISYQVTAGAEVDATDAYPPEGSSYPTSCTAETGFGLTACVTDPALQAELTSVLAAHSLTANDSNMYIVFFPPNVQTCFGAGTSNCSYSGTHSRGSYCGYHDNFGTISADNLYADMPYPPLSGCAGGEAPNGDAQADAMVSIVSHEANETITDYDNAWRDSVGFEDGDECAYTYGVPLGGSAGTLHNQVINGSNYYTQDEFSNANYALSQGDVTQVGGVKVKGCVQRPNSIAAHLVVTAPATATSGSPVSVSVKAVDGGGNTVTGYTGTVHFSSTDGAVTLPANYTFAASDNGIHSFNVTFNTTGSQTVTATDANTGTISGTSGTVTVTVSLRPTTTTASATPISSSSGQSVTYGVHVTPTSGTGVPTGTVTFKVGATTLCTTPALDGSGNGSCSASNAPVGTDTVTATYSGDATFATSSGTTTETVSGAPSAPTNLSATAVSAHEVDLSWTGSLGATGYNVSRSTDGVNFTQVATGVTGTGYADAQHLRVPGSGTGSTPNSGALAITGDIDIRVKASLDSWAGGSYQPLIEKHSSYFAYDLAVNGSGNLFALFGTGSGSTSQYALSTTSVSFGAGATGWVRVTRVASTGAVTFYTSTDGVTWTQLGTTVSTTAGALPATTDSLYVGGGATGYYGTVMAGNIYYAEVRSGINGTVVASPDFTAASGSPFSDAIGNTWSIGGSASLQGGPALSSGTTYYYKVQAVDAGGTSGYSNVASTTTSSG